MASSKKTWQQLNLPMKPLPIVSTAFPTTVTGTSDHLPGYFESEWLETTTIPEGWDIHFEIINQMRVDNYWNDARRLIAAGVSLSSAGAKFATEWNQMTGECLEDFRLGEQKKQKVVEMKVKSFGAVAEWNEKMARLRRNVEMQRDVFVGLARAGTFHLGIMACFAAHRNLGRDGDGEKWWTETVEKLMGYSEQWMAAPFTLEMWLEELAVSVNQQQEEDKLEDIRVYADALCASYEQAEGMRSRRELVYLIKGGEMIKKGTIAWVSVELGHVTRG